MEQEFDTFTKAGFARLLRLFENTDDVVKLTRAFSLAARAHKGETWNKSEPYINHPLRVALILAEELQIHDLDLACAALLHDTSEQNYSQELSEFGDRVISVTRMVSSEPRPKSELASDNALAKYFQDLAKSPKDARVVKSAEKLDSARGMKNQGFMEKAKRFKDEVQKYVLPIAEGTNDKLAFKLSVALYELK